MVLSFWALNNDKEFQDPSFMFASWWQGKAQPIVSSRRPVSEGNGCSTELSQLLCGRKPIQSWVFRFQNLSFHDPNLWKIDKLGKNALFRRSTCMIPINTKALAVQVPSQMIFLFLPTKHCEGALLAGKLTPYGRGQKPHRIQGKWSTLWKGMWN